VGYGYVGYPEDDCCMLRVWYGISVLCEVGQDPSPHNIDRRLVEHDEMRRIERRGTEGRYMNGETAPRDWEHTNKCYRWPLSSVGTASSCVACLTALQLEVGNTRLVGWRFKGNQLGEHTVRYREF